MIILSLFIIAIAVSLVVMGYKLNRAAAKCNHFPGISLIEFFRDARNLPLRTAYYNEKFAKIVTPVVTLVLATHPDSVKFVLNDTDKFPKTVLDTFKNSSKIFGNNIVFSNGQQWRQYRNVLSPPFHFDAVKKWIPDFRKLTVDLMEQWAKISDKPIDIMYWVPLFTLDVLGVTVLSRNFNAMKGEESDDLAAVNVILANANKPLMLLLGYIEKKLGLNIVRKINNSIEYITGSMNDIVNTRKAMKIKDENHHYDLIDVMLAAHDPDWTERDLISNAFIMFVAGHETTATALGWMFYYLSTLPEIQNKLKEEVDRVLKGQPITQDNIRELTYMSNVIKENLRIQPPVAYLPTRDVKEDVYFEGKLIPKGSIIGLNIYSIHHSPELWSEPEKFDPDRFTKPTVPFGFLPFSLKSRACLGNQFSLVEQTVFLATLMQHYNVTLHSHVPAPEVAGINKVGNIKVNLSKWEDVLLY